MKYNGLTDKQVEESRSKFGSNEIPAVSYTHLTLPTTHIV